MVELMQAISPSFVIEHDRSTLPQILADNEQCFYFDPAGRVEKIFAERGSHYECDWVQRSLGNRWTMHHLSELGEQSSEYTGQQYWPVNETTVTRNIINMVL